MKQAEAVIRTQDLTKRFPSGGGEIVIFERLNLEVRRGEKLAIIGESGAGKSTLLHLLGGLDYPTSGRIFFEAQEVTAMSESGRAEFRNRQIGFVWQNHYLLPEFTALENVMMPLLIRAVAYEAAAPKAMARLEEVGLKQRAHHRSGELSGGEQQRVVLARALIGQPKYLLADEPTGSLDWKTGSMITGLLADVHKHHRLTSIYVTHNIGFAQQCDRVMRMAGGRLEPLSRQALKSVMDEAENGSSYV